MIKSNVNVIESDQGKSCCMKMSIEAVVLNIMIRSNVNVIDQSDQGKNCCMKISIETFEIMI